MEYLVGHVVIYFPFRTVGVVYANVDQSPLSGRGHVTSSQPIMAICRWTVIISQLTSLSH